MPEQKASTQDLCETFMKSIQPEFPKKITVEYERPGSDAIPMPMYSGEPIPMP